MKRTRILFLPLLLTAALAVSCAVNPKEDDNISYDHMMEAWMRINHPGVKPYGDYGAYVLDMYKGDGPAIADSSYIRVHYTKSFLDGTIVETNVKELAQQMGTYAVSSNYNGNTWRMTQGYVPDALEEVFRTMRSGGYTTIALPKSSSSHLYSMYDAFTSTEEANNYLYEFVIDTVINDIISYQDKEMRAWFRSHYDSEATIDEHQFFKKLEEHTADSDTIPEGTSVSVRYIGRLMNGQVFDTNIEDTAKFYRIWSGDKTYSGMDISYYKSDESKFASDNSVVTGFGNAILKMNMGEKAVTVFNSDLGYGADGKNPAIPEYSPLVFWLYIESTN